MSAHRPKILTAITVPTGGWDLDFTVSVGGSLDTPLTATIPAGTYFVAWDHQADDLLYHVAKEMQDAITAGPGGARYVEVWLDPNNKVNIFFRGSAFNGAPGYDIELNWTTSDSDLAAALGFDSSADDSSTGTNQPIFTADWPHSHGWYANADGQLASLRTEDWPATETSQLIAYSGHSYAQQVGERYTNELALQWLPRSLVYSRDIGYGTAPLHPFARNVPLECWWLEAQQGTRFRVYREGRNDTTTAVDRIEQTANNTTTVTDSNKSMDTDPQQHKGRLLHIVDMKSDVTLHPGRFYIASHTATVLTSPQAHASGLNWMYPGDNTCLVLDQRYQTYIVDLARMPTFDVRERAGHDYYDITIPLLRYESPT